VSNTHPLHGSYRHSLTEPFLSWHFPKALCLAETDVPFWSTPEREYALFLTSPLVFKSHYVKVLCNTSSFTSDGDVKTKINNYLTSQKKNKIQQNPI